MSDIKGQCSAVLFVAAAGSFTVACREPHLLSWSEIIYFTGCMQMFFLTDIQALSSTLVSLLDEKPMFWYRSWWTMCRKLWGPKERGPQTLSYGLYFSVQLLCGTTPVHLWELWRKKFLGSKPEVEWIVLAGLIWIKIQCKVFYTCCLSEGF